MDPLPGAGRPLPPLTTGPARIPPRDAGGTGAGGPGNAASGEAASRHRLTNAASGDAASRHRLTGDDPPVARSDPGAVGELAFRVTEGRRPLAPLRRHGALTRVG